MKRIIVIATSALIFIIGGFLVGNFLQYKKVTFSIDEQTEKVKVYLDERGSLDVGSSTEVGEATNGQTLRLKTGSYFYTPIGNNVDSSAVSFRVDSDIYITVNPPYSNGFLSTLTQQESESIKGVINTKYPEIMKKFSFNTLSVLGRGQYAGVIIVPADMDQDNPAGYYRALLQKDDQQKWQIIGRPEIVLTKYNTPDIDIDILTAVNNLSLE